jgi:branched-chain amino acid aminotransferase
MFLLILFCWFLCSLKFYSILLPFSLFNFLLSVGNFRDDEFANLDWDNLGFGMVPTDYMYIMKCSKGESFEHGQLSHFGNIELSPASGVLNYGQVSYS